MTRDCADCGQSYDDAECLTFCPHDRFISAEDTQRKNQAILLLGQVLQWQHVPHDRDTLRAVSVSFTGMVTIDGYAGEFAPHLFRVIPSQQPQSSVTDPERRVLDNIPEFGDDLVPLCRCPPSVCLLHPGRKTCGMRDGAQLHEGT